MSVVIDHNDFIRDFIAAFGPDYNYVIKAIENNNHKKLHFLKYLSSQGFIPVGSEENLHEMIKIFEQKFQGNQDLAFEVEGNFEFFELRPYFKVLYPEIEITNTNKEKHTIKNLVVVFSLTWDSSFKKWKIDEMTGLRLTLSYLEFNKFYPHSHLSASRLTDNFKSMTSSKFCLGSSTLGMSIAEYNTESNKEQSNLVLEGILYTLDTYVTWESLEGVPHNYIRNLIPFGGTPVSDSYLDSHSIGVVNFLKENKIPLALEYGVMNDSIFIKNSLENAEFFKGILQNSLISGRYTLQRDYLCFPSQGDTFLQADSNFYSVAQIRDLAKDYKRDYLYNLNKPFTFFNGRKHSLVFSFYMEKKIQKDEQNIIIYPKFLKHVYRKLESQIQKARLRSQAVRHFTTLRSAKGSPRQDQVTL